jgi:UDP-2-acetamido-2-deoxy-ribo-hexuluronate aminotransferase
LNSFPDKIEMVNLRLQHKKLESQIMQSIGKVIESSSFIKGREVAVFEQNLASLLGVDHVISCANGTDALQIALMALDLKPGDEVIVPAFTYVATAEVIALLGGIPVMVDVEEDTFNISLAAIEKSITSRTRVIIPVHLFGQSSDMEPLMNLAEKYNLWVVEDNAQSLGASCTFNSGETRKAGTIGHIGCTSFFPTKNLGCMGDGGALITNNAALAEKIRMIANHGQQKKYYHKIVGCNSRLDTIQAAILNVKLPHLGEYLDARRHAAEYYLGALGSFSTVILPVSLPSTPNTFNQFTLKIRNGQRDTLRNFLTQRGIPSMIYYPLPLYRQEAFLRFSAKEFVLPVTEKLCSSVLSLPIHTEMNEKELEYIAENLLRFKE